MEKDAPERKKKVYHKKTFFSTFRTFDLKMWDHRSYYDGESFRHSSQTEVEFLKELNSFKLYYLTQFTTVNSRTKTRAWDRV